MHLVVCLTTGSYLPKRVPHTVQSSASAFGFQYFLGFNYNYKLQTVSHETPRRYSFFQICTEKILCFCKDFKQAILFSYHCILYTNTYLWEMYTQARERACKLFTSLADRQDRCLIGYKLHFLRIINFSKRKCEKFQLSGPERQ